MTSKIFSNPTILKILESYQEVWALVHLLSLSSWDGEVYMPDKGIVYRGIAQAKAQTLIQKAITDKTFQVLISRAENEDLNVYEKAVIRVLKRESKFYTKLPKEFLEEFEHTISRSLMSWRKAKEQDNFDLFADDLTKIIELSRQKADYLGYEKYKYDALLDQYEEGSTVEELDPYFKDVVEFLEILVNKITSSKNYLKTHDLLDEKYDIESAKKLNREILKLLNYDKKKLRLDISSHPFSEGLSTDDSRITTRYEGYDIGRTITSTIHEFGHALYFLQHNPVMNTTPLYTGYSLGLHESQSRFFENHIGRSKEFIERMVPMIHKLVENYDKYSNLDFYRYFNLVKPSLIRVEADEVTYHGHIFVRYTIEKKLMQGEIESEDVPKIWNELYRDILSIEPINNKEGCLQDIHWSMGAIGYFPTYSQGTVFAADVAQTLEKDLGTISDLVQTKPGIEKIHKWLYKNFHQYGATYPFEALSIKLTGSKFETEPWKKYLTKKYSDLYN